MADVAQLIDDVVGSRLTAAGDPPGLREAAIALATDTLHSDAHAALIEEQIEQLGRRGSRLIPDAYFAFDSAAEDALQLAAAGMRSAMAQSGSLVEARRFERDLVRRIGDDPGLAMRAEFARVPRPAVRPAELDWSVTPVPWERDLRDPAPWPPPSLKTMRRLSRLPSGPAGLARVEAGAHAGWVQIGFVEHQETPPRRHPELPGRTTMTVFGLELDGEAGRADGTVPLCVMPWQVWTTPRRDETSRSASLEAIASAGREASPLIGLAVLPRGASGLGRPAFVLAPAPLLVGGLGLVPAPDEFGFVMTDVNGPALVGRLWRAHLVHDGSYQPLVHAVTGADLLLRPDLLERVTDLFGEPRLSVGLSVSCQSDD